MFSLPNLRKTSKKFARPRAPSEINTIYFETADDKVTTRTAEQARIFKAQFLRN